MKLKLNKKGAMLVAGVMSLTALPTLASSNGLLGLNLTQVVTTADVSELTTSLGLPDVPVVDSILKMDNEILIQGGEIKVLRELIEKVGGLVTHELPLVGGIGVRVSDLQLAILQKLPSSLIKITKNDAVFTSSALDHCSVYGSHVVDLKANKIRWNLYNAKDMHANAEEMTFTWPERLGNVRSVTFNGRLVYWSLFGLSLIHI